MQFKKSAGNYLFWGGLTSAALGATLGIDYLNNNKQSRQGSVSKAMLYGGLVSVIASYLIDGIDSGTEAQRIADEYNGI